MLLETLVDVSAIEDAGAAMIPDFRVESAHVRSNYPGYASCVVRST